MKPYFETKLGKLYHGDCLEIMSELEPVDLVLTSPPYDNLRDYEGYTFDFEKVANGLYSIINKGGVVVWVVGDATVKGSETGTSFKQALYFKEIGFNLHDTMIFQKANVPVYDPRNKRYKSAFEYMFILSKGAVATYNPISDTPTKKKSSRGVTKRNPNGSMREPKDVNFKKFRDRDNVWVYPNGYMQTTKDRVAFQHPAIMSEFLAQDHIISWSNEGETVADIMAGSGTTLKMAEKLNRRWIGIEIEEKYCEIAAKRIEKENQQLKLF